MKYKIRNKVWLWGGGEKGSWHFVSIPPEIAEKISNKYKEFKKGWGSLPVLVTVKSGKEKLELRTSIFPNKKDGIYILPLKKEFRKIVGIQDGDIFEGQLEILISKNEGEK